MNNIQRYDKNFAVDCNIEKEDIEFYNIVEHPFKTYGVFHENGRYRRMPERIAQKISEGVYGLHTNTASGRVRFVTDSRYVAICAKWMMWEKLQTVRGAARLDLIYMSEIHIQRLLCHQWI